MTCQFSTVEPCGSCKTRLYSGGGGLWDPGSLYGQVQWCIWHSKAVPSTGKLPLQWQGLRISASTWSVLPVTLMYFRGSEQTYFKRESYSKRFPELRVLFTFGEFPGSGQKTVSTHVGQGEGYSIFPSMRHFTFNPVEEVFQSVSARRAIPSLHGYHVLLLRCLRFPSHMKFKFVPAGLSVRLSQYFRWHSNTAGGSVYSVFHLQLLSRVSLVSSDVPDFLILYRRSRQAHLGCTDDLNIWFFASITLPSPCTLSCLGSCDMRMKYRNLLFSEWIGKFF